MDPQATQLVKLPILMEKETCITGNASSQKQELNSHSCTIAQGLSRLRENTNELQHIILNLPKNMKKMNKKVVDKLTVERTKLSMIAWITHLSTTRITLEQAKAHI
jgi:hypothetical protein